MLRANFTEGYRGAAEETVCGKQHATNLLPFFRPKLSMHKQLIKNQLITLKLKLPLKKTLCVLAHFPSL